MEKSIYTAEYAALLSVLKCFRAEAELTQTELAERLDETQSVVSKIERGDRRLDLVELRTICHACGRSLSDFVSAWEAAIAAEE